MWEHGLVTRTDLSAAELWAVAADVANWPGWQPGVEAARFVAGGESLVVREWGRFVRRTVEESRPPSRLVVTASLVLAQTRTVYEFRPVAGGTRIGVTVQLLGPLRFLYSRSLGARLEQGLPELVRQLIERARVSTDSVGVGRLARGPVPVGV